MAVLEVLYDVQTVSGNNPNNPSLSLSAFLALRLHYLQRFLVLRLIIKAQSYRENQGHIIQGNEEALAMAACVHEGIEVHTRILSSFRIY